MPGLVLCFRSEAVISLDSDILLLVDTCSEIIIVPASYVGSMLRGWQTPALRLGPQTDGKAGHMWVIGRFEPSCSIAAKKKGTCLLITCSCLDPSMFD